MEVRAKLTVLVSVRMDDDLVARLDELVRRRMRETGRPSSRSLLSRELIEEGLEQQEMEIAAERARG